MVLCRIGAESLQTIVDRRFIVVGPTWYFLALLYNQKKRFDSKSFLAFLLSNRRKNATHCHSSVGKYVFYRSGEPSPHLHIDITLLAADESKIRSADQVLLGEGINKEECSEWKNILLPMRYLFLISFLSLS